MRYTLRVSYADAIRSYPRIALLSHARVCVLAYASLYRIAAKPKDTIRTIEVSLLRRLVRETNLIGDTWVDPGHSVPTSHSYESPFEYAKLPRTKVQFQQPKKRS
jgi:hypothetical protein